MGVTCEILIQIPKEKKHLTGEPIKGIVKLHVDKVKVYKKISLSLIEKRLTWFDYGHKQKRDYDTKRIWAGKHVQYEGVEANTVNKIYLLEKQTNENLTLKAGTHEIPFEIMIPENIPPTVDVFYYEEPFAGIEYYLILKLKKPASFSVDTYFKTKITIYNQIDSSVTEDPITVTQNKSLIKLFSSKKHEIRLEAVLDKGYLIPDSERNISFAVINKSDVMFNIQTELLCETSAKPDFEDRKEIREVIEKVETPTIPDNSVTNLFNAIPVRPGLCTVRHSDMISREYRIRVTLRLPPPHINSSVDIPVVIGEKLVQKMNDEASGSTDSDEEPPTYWEAVVCEEKSKH